MNLVVACYCDLSLECFAEERPTGLVGFGFGFRVSSALPKTQRKPANNKPSIMSISRTSQDTNGPCQRNKGIMSISCIFKDHHHHLCRQRHKRPHPTERAWHHEHQPLSNNKISHCQHNMISQLRPPTPDPEILKDVSSFLGNVQVVHRGASEFAGL